MLQYSVLLAAAVSIAIIHCFCPDHWALFPILAQLRGWSKRKLIIITSLSALGHVVLSVLIGAAALYLGMSLAGVESFEVIKAEYAILCVGIGIICIVWGITRAKYEELRPDLRYLTITWILFLIFVLGPCEAIIALTFLAAAYGWPAIYLVSIVFIVISVLEMNALTLLGYIGIKSLNPTIWERHTHTISGIILTLTALSILIVP